MPKGREDITDVDFKVRNRNVWRWRKAGLTLREVSERAGISHEHARQIILKMDMTEAKAAGRLKKERETFAWHMKVVWPTKNAMGKLRRVRGKRYLTAVPKSASL